MDESITTDMLKAADTDGDGEISLDEFKTIMRAGPDVKPKAEIGGLAGGIKGGIDGTVGLAKKGIDGTVDGAKGAVNKVGDVGKGALEATLKTLGGQAAFQQVFASTIDKSDAGLTKAFEKVDADSSGHISAKEMSSHIASVYGGYALPSRLAAEQTALCCDPLPQWAALLM